VFGAGTSFPEADDSGTLRNQPAPMESPRASPPRTLANRRARRRGRWGRLTRGGVHGARAEHPVLGEATYMRRPQMRCAPLRRVPTRNALAAPPRLLLMTMSL